MKTTVILLSGLMILVQVACLQAVEAPPPIEPGDTIESVVQKLGKPQGVVSGGRRTTYYYEQGTVDFVDGKVEKALLMSKEEGRERTARLEREEANHRQQVEAERKRIADAGAAELTRILADKSFAARPASERLEYWNQFAKQYPYTDISAPMAQVAEAVKVGQKEGDRENELAAMNKRVGEILERFKQLDDDYAASLANWKRTEIDAERARLKDELEGIDARVRELGGAR